MEYTNDELIESWINGNKSFVCEEVRKMDNSELIIFLREFRECEYEHI